MRFLLHIILLFTTLGIGNLILAVCFPPKKDSVIIINNNMKDKS